MKSRRDLIVGTAPALLAGLAGCASVGTGDASPGGAEVEAAILVRGRELYRALQTSDVTAIRTIFSPDFQGELTAGLPNGFGRRYDGLDAMMSEGWGRVGRLFQMSPQPERLIDGGDVLVGMGFYVGSALPTKKPVRAVFAHFWSWNGTQFTGVRQITDSGVWRDALSA